MVTVSDTARLANGTRCELGEGPFWDAPRGRLLWVDIVSGTVHVGVIQRDGTVETVESVPFDETIGAVAPAANGQWILAGSDRILMRTPDGHLTPGLAILPGDGRRRCNDAKPDPAGRFVVGTLHTDGAQPVPAELLLRIEPDGALTTIDDDLTLANGLAWSRDGTRMYSVDTLRQVVYVRSYDPVSGATGARSELVRLEDGYPDGMCLDAEEHLWVAVWGKGQVHRYSPEGELVEVIDVPAPHTSSVAFAGDDLRTMVITTATQGLTDAQLRRFPHSGCLFTVEPGAPGLPQPLWAGPARTDEPDRADAAGGPT